MYNCDESKYISTLNPLYYQSEAGKAVLYLIDHYKPDMYIELHCYKRENFDSLTDLDRKKKIGVPPLIELEEGVLIGSNITQNQDHQVYQERYLYYPGDTLFTFT